jgi:sec-independent protein translocase protein TatA
VFETPIGANRQDCSDPLEYTVEDGRAAVVFGRPVGGYMGEGLFQPMHLLVIFFIALLVFGPRKLPELGKGLGDGIRALKEGMKDNKGETKAEVKTEVKPEVQPEVKTENKV